jgi:hypothetical protein
VGPKFHKPYQLHPYCRTSYIGVKDRTTLIIWAKRVIAKHNLLKLVQTKATQMEKSLQELNYLFEELFIKGLPPFWMEKENCMNRKNITLASLSEEWTIQF